MYLTINKKKNILTLCSRMGTTTAFILGRQVRKSSIARVVGTDTCRMF